MTDVRKYSTGEARDNFAQIVNETVYGDHRVVLTRHGKNIAALVPFSDLELLHELERVIDLEDARRALSEAEEHGTITLDELKEKLDL